MSHERISVKQLQSLDRRELLELYDKHKSLYHEWIRRLILIGHRVDILAEVVLGYRVDPHHLEMLNHQYRWRGNWCQTLVWRGSGKTTIATVSWDIFQLLLNPNRSILIASKTGNNAADMLKEIKQQFETNEMLHRLFGNYVGKSLWSDTEIEVAGRTQPSKEPSINTIGIEGAVASKHYDIIDADDLVDEENSRTLYQREKMLNWFYKMLLPTLKQPIPSDPFIGSLNIKGTRFHHMDLHGHLSKRQDDDTGGELEGPQTLIIPILLPNGEVRPNSLGFTQDKVATLRRGGIIRFNSQYMLNTDVMKGSIFSIDDCQVIDDKDIPWGSIAHYAGVDLMISEEDEADMFAMVAVGIDKLGNIYVLAYYEKQLSYPKQTAAVADFYDDNECIRVGIESNAYQKAQFYNVKKDFPHINAVAIITLKDKVTEAKNLSPLYQKVFFRRNMSHLIEHLVLFPHHRYDDLFDALNLAIKTSKRRAKKKRRSEPGLM